MFTVDDHGSDTSASDDGDNLLAHLLQIDGLAEHAVWLSKLTTPNGYITCKLDTGAETSVLPTTAFNSLYVRLLLQPTYITLTTYGGSTINPIGTCELQWDCKENPHKIKFYVVDVNSQPVLGLRDCEKLGLIK